MLEHLLQLVLTSDTKHALKSDHMSPIYKT